MAKSKPGVHKNRSRKAAPNRPLPVPAPPHLKTRDSRVRNIILSDYQYYGARYVKRKYGISRRTLARWKGMMRKKGSLEPEPRRGGAPRKLSPQEEETLSAKLLRHPEASNKKLAKAVGNRITPRSAGNYVRRSPQHFTWKLEQLDDEATFTREHYEQGLYFMHHVKRVPLKKRVYVDETATNAGVRRRKVRTPRKVPFWRRHNRKYRRVTVVSAISLRGFRHKSRLYNKGSLSTEEFESYVRRYLIPTVHPGDVVLWDRWGRSGRARNPVAHHYSPTARKLIEAVGACLLLLPPHGKLFDPIEPIFGEVKKNFDSSIRKNFKDVNPSTIDFKEIRRLWAKAEEKISQASFERSFKERANGVEFMRVSNEKGLVNL